MKHSIRVRFTLIFVGIIAVTIGACLFINQFFLENFYLQNKQQVLMDAYNHMNELLDSARDDETSQMEALLRDLRDSNNISAIIIDGGGGMIYYSTPDYRSLQNRLSWYLFADVDGETAGPLIVDRIYESDQYNIILIENQLAAGNATYMESWGFFSNGGLFLMSLPVESIRESVAVSNEFYLIIGIIAIIVSAVIVFFMTRKLTKPLQELSAISEQMAGLDFHVRYHTNAQDEVGILGNSMNHLADALERAIGELQTANAQLKKDIEEKIQIDDMRKEFLSNVSHELKTPIAIIQGYAEGLKDGINDDDEESRNFYCDVIIDESSKMNQMVQKLLNLNQLEFGNSEVETEVFDIMALIEGVVHASEILIKQKEGTIFLPKGNPVYVNADEFMIEEVVKNYLSNAIHHLEGEKVIQISLREMGDCVRISVFNTGQPIPEEDLDKVWIKFFKVDKARTREYGGSGIGLSIVKAIIDKHHQRCGVENRENGVEFWFTLKLEKNIEKNEINA